MKLFYKKGEKEKMKAQTIVLILALVLCVVLAIYSYLPKEVITIIEISPTKLPLIIKP